MTTMTRSRAARRWGVGVATTALVAAAGGFVGANWAGGGTSGTGTVTPAAAMPAAQLNTALDTTAATATPRLRRALTRLRRLPGMYGQVSVRTARHGTVTIAFERGVVTGTGGSVTVRAANGATETWRLTNTTVVREHGTRVNTNTLTDQEHVFVIGPLSGGTRAARLILVTGAPRPHASSPSPGTTTG